MNKTIKISETDHQMIVVEWAGWIDRFEEKIEPEPNSGCWIWTSTWDHAGYGKFKINNKNKMAHRVSYELYRSPIPEGLIIDHLCRVKCCVNPNHLEPVTQKENVNRGKAGLWNRIKTHCSKGHEFSQDNTYLSLANRRGCRECNRKINREKYRRRVENTKVS